MIENMNTLEAYETLKKVQFTDEQSREIVRLVARVHETEPASRKDLMESESNVRMEMKNTELRLQKEIEGVRLEIKNTELKLSKEIEGVRLEIKNTELKLSKEIKELDAKLSVKLEKIHSDFIRWLIGAAIASGGLLLTALRFMR
ncbi:MAG TPA: hypothetical protein PL048_19520 [Leptospiraceae bacterium]|nr:hypothetical protein [Leptospiraceae bacterium]HMY67393.1 hypothetical protein [Leptospiraceae bacterium]HMZ60976.1 hypothetical protein [Leptospiraceae bacterium]HNF15917.1 hypothetical protein [Leptospiraceae bacterium]HNF22822.1 hypothetical protein [Leptospiraceae bacterium]